MESFDMFLNTNFVALDHFSKVFGVETSPGVYAIPTKWQSALFQSGQCGAFVGVYLAGPITNKIGYRWTTMLGLVLMNATIFISFFVSDLLTSVSLPPHLTHFCLGKLPHSPRGRPSPRRCPMGFLHRQLPSLRQ